MPMRPASSTCNVLMKPSPSRPTSASAGTRQSSNSTSLVSLARMPSLFSFFPALRPGVPRSTTNAEMPRRPSARSVIAITTMVAGNLAVRDELLGAVDHPLAAGPVRRRPHRGRVAARARLGQRPRPERLAAGKWNHVLPALLVAAEHGQVGHREPVVRRHGERDRRVHARQFFDAHAVVERRHARAAVLLGHLDARQANRRQSRHQLRRKPLRLVPIHDERPDFRLRELTHGPAQQLLFGRGPQIHQTDNTITQLAIGGWRLVIALSEWRIGDHVDDWTIGDRIE